MESAIANPQANEAHIDISPMSIPTAALSELRHLGAVGVAKSLYYSQRFTDSPTSILLHSRVTTDVSSDTNFDIGGRIAFGRNQPALADSAIHPSKLSTTTGSSITHTGTDMAIIGPGSVVHVEGQFSIGDSFINGHANLLCGSEITIGDDVAIAWGFDALDDDRHQLYVDGEAVAQSDPIDIRDHVWIGHDVTVQKGVTIHEGSVVASNSLVTDDVPPDTLVAGSPAEVVRENISWE